MTALVIVDWLRISICTRDAMSTLLRPSTSVYVYARSDAFEMAEHLANRFWPRPTEGLGFDSQEMLAVTAELIEIGRTRRGVEPAGLNGDEFTLHVYHLMKLFIYEHARSSRDPSTAAADSGHTALRDAFYIMLASSPSGAVRTALDQERTLIESGRPKGLDWYSRARQRRKLEQQAPDVRAVYKELMASCRVFLAAS